MESSVDALVAKHKQKAQEKEKAQQDSEQKKASEGQQDTPAVDEQVIQFVQEKSFRELGVCDEIVGAIEKIGYKHPSKIQAESLPYTLQGRDIIGLAETGSGKTAAFAIPVI